jgi:hypothetical protein
MVMFFLFFKVLVLVGAVKLHSIKEEPLYPAILYSIPLALISLVFGSTFIGALISGAILFALSFAYFWMLSTVPDGMPYYATFGIGALILILVI